MVGEPKNWLQAARKVWPRLTELARNGDVAYYEDIAPLIPTNPLNVGRALGPIQSYCSETKRPPLTALVISKTTGKPGPGFFAWDGDLADGLDLVFDYDWQKVANPFGKLAPADTEESLVAELLRAPDMSGSVYERLPDRGVAQTVFRAALLQAYECRCSFCEFSFKEALDGAHIIPWQSATASERLDVRNGLLLCSTHHRMFDNRLIAPTTDFMVRYCDPEEANGPYSASDTSMSSALHGKPMHLPADSGVQPSAEYIARRLRMDRWD